MSQVISSKTVSNMLTVTKRTPARSGGAARRQLWPKIEPVFRARLRLAMQFEACAPLREYQGVRLLERGIEQARIGDVLELADERSTISRQLRRRSTRSA